MRFFAVDLSQESFENTQKGEDYPKREIKREREKEWD